MGEDVHAWSCERLDKKEVVLSCAANKAIRKYVGADPRPVGSIQAPIAQHIGSSKPAIGLFHLPLEHIQTLPQRKQGSPIKGLAARLEPRHQRMTQSGAAAGQKRGGHNVLQHWGSDRRGPPSPEPGRAGLSRAGPVGAEVKPISLLQGIAVRASSGMIRTGLAARQRRQR